MTNIWHHWPGVDPEIAAIFDPFGNAVHTALAFPVLGEDVLVSGAGPIGLMATAVVRHAGARHVVVSDPNPYRASAGHADGRDRGGRPARARPDGRRRPSSGWSKASTSPSRCPACPAPSAPRSRPWPMAAASPCSASRPRRSPIDLNAVVFKMLTLRGIYGREMYETWYKMTVMLQSGLRHRAGDHPPVRVTATSRRRSPPPGPASPARSSWTGRHDRSAGLPRRRTRRSSGRSTSTAPLRVMSSAQGPIVSVDRATPGQPVVERLPGPDPSPAPARGGPGGRPRVRRRQRGGPDDRRDDVDARGARGGTGGVQGRHPRS